MRGFYWIKRKKIITTNSGISYSPTNLACMDLLFRANFFAQPFQPCFFTQHFWLLFHRTFFAAFLHNFFGCFLHNFFRCFLFRTNFSVAAFSSFPSVANSSSSLAKSPSSSQLTMCLSHPHILCEYLKLCM
jgi:hypothetical protein